MAVLYKTVQSILANKAGVKVFYPRVVLKGHVSTDQIARGILFSEQGRHEKRYRQPGACIDHPPSIFRECDSGWLRHVPHGYEDQRQRCGKRRQGIGCTSHNDRAFSALLHEES